MDVTIKAPRQGGFALVTGAVLLVVLTLVAVTAMKSTTLEMRMSSNELTRMETMDASEAPRVLTADLLDVHAFNRGWPKSIGGDVENTVFDYTIPSGLSVRDKNADKTPDGFLAGNTEASYSPTGLTPDLVYQRTITPSGQTPLTRNAGIAVYKLRTAIAPGAGAAMVAGYEGTGKSAAAAGGNIFFRVLSTGVDANASWDATKEEWIRQDGEPLASRVCTACEYRHVIRN